MKSEVLASVPWHDDSRHTQQMFRLSPYQVCCQPCLMIHQSKMCPTRNVQWNFTNIQAMTNKNVLSAGNQDIMTIFGDGQWSNLSGKIKSWEQNFRKQSNLVFMSAGIILSGEERTSLQRMERERTFLDNYLHWGCNGVLEFEIKALPHVIFYWRTFCLCLIWAYYCKIFLTGL